MVQGTYHREIIAITWVPGRNHHILKVRPHVYKSFKVQVAWINFIIRFASISFEVVPLAGTRE
jgi:hypothetical protein